MDRTAPKHDPEAAAPVAQLHAQAADDYAHAQARAAEAIESLALAMSRMARSPEASKYLREHFAEPNALHEFAESQLSDRKDQRAAIFVDQFEDSLHAGFQRRLSASPF